MMLTLLGPTASGKTALAVQIACSVNAEIISADSRQVYKGMDIGTGKDLSEYELNGVKIPYHLIDICEPGEEYNVYRFVQDFEKAETLIQKHGNHVLLCGGTGMYIEAVLKGYNLVTVPVNEELREELYKKPMDELVGMILALGPVHATSDLINKERIIPAIEKRLYYKTNNIPELKEGRRSLVFGVKSERESQRKRITARLHQRLDEGMVDEVKMLIAKGVEVKQLISYGLEYKWITLYLTGKCSYEEMVSSLNVAIHRFAKRQMTWFRRMEKNGIYIQWLNAEDSLEHKMDCFWQAYNK
jgi:tRNA dimethylallyltransferase